jgi:hypothetical protein
VKANAPPDVLAKSGSFDRLTLKFSTEYLVDSRRGDFMKSKYKFILSLVFCLFVTNTLSALAQNEPKKRKVPHISAQQAYFLHQQGKIILLDVHRRHKKTRASILGAIYVDPKTIDRQRFRFPGDKIVGVYCE